VGGKEDILEGSSLKQPINVHWSLKTGRDPKRVDQGGLSFFWCPEEKEKKSILVRIRKKVFIIDTVYQKSDLQPIKRKKGVGKPNNSNDKNRTRAWGTNRQSQGGEKEKGLNSRV